MAGGETRTGNAVDPVSELLGAILDAPPAERQQALAAACTSHPQHADLLRRRLHALGGLGLLEEEQPGGLAVPAMLGEFRLTRRLGHGGMGVVYRARQEPLGREVALKLMRPELVFFENNRERFQREAEAIARLDHPAIVPVLTYGEEAGIPYLAMPFIDGCSLADVIEALGEREPRHLEGDDLARAMETAGTRVEAAARRALSAPSWCGMAALVCRQVAEALAHAHERGIVHRDVKPSNIMLASDGRVLLVDFGLAKAAGASRLTRTGSQLGSLPYSAPEQVLGNDAPIDARSDVFSLGTVLYELLTLARAFDGENNQQTMRAILTREPVDPRRRNDAVGPDLAAVLAKALEKDPDHRYGSARALADDLGSFLAYRPVAAARHSWFTRCKRWVRREPTRAAAVAASAVAVLSLAALLGYWMASYETVQAGRAKLAAEALETDLARGFLALAHGERAVAEAAFRAAQGRDPASAAARAGLGLLGLAPLPAADVSRRSEPPVLFQEAMRILFLGPRGDPSQAARAQSLLEYANARTLVARPLYRFGLAQAAAVAGDGDAAARAADSLVALWPDSAFAHYWAGYALLDVDLARATRELESAVGIDPAFARAWSDLGLARHRGGLHDGAEAALRKAIEVGGGNARTLVNLGIVLDARGDRDAAIHEMKRAIDIDGTFPGAHYNLGRVLALQGDNAAAIESLERAVELEPRYVEALKNLGIVRARERDVQGAIHAYEKVVALLPQDAAAHRYLCSLLAHVRDRRRLRAERERFARATGKDAATKR